MKNAETIIRGQRAAVSFLSRYRGESDYEIYRDGQTGRIRQTDDGTAVSRSEHFSDEDARSAIAAYVEAEAEMFVDWATKRAADACPVKG